MRRFTTSFNFKNSKKLKEQLLQWSVKNYDTVCFFDNNSYNGYSYNTYEALLAIGEKAALKCNSGKAFETLKFFFKEKQDWLFGFFGYDLKNEIEALHSKNFDGLEFPDLYFFQPEIVIEIFQDHALVHSCNEADDLSQFYNSGNFSEPPTKEADSTIRENILRPRFSKEEYLQTVEKILKHIQRGDIYEMNFCQEFFSENAAISPLKTFNTLNDYSQAPFASFLKVNGNYLLSASPERFLKKIGNKLISMPIKGTTRRGKNENEDAAARERLFYDPKERSENVMIVDLVRNDLSRSCEAGSVQVEELFGVKTFRHVHHLVSTISGTLRDDVHFIDAIKNAFPMGSMTGAPKVRAMQLIEDFEKTRRGLYSGAVGYITPGGDFDFNVVIRSLIYNSERQYLSLQAGGAITIESDPVKEYDECVLKAEALINVLQRKDVSASKPLQ